MEQVRNSVRRGTRLPLKLPIRVFCKESDECEWTEQTRLLDVSAFGAGFILSRPIAEGRMIRLSIPLPPKLRCYDHTAPMYSIWSLVRYASAIPTDQPQETAFRIGVAFVGREPPVSYREDPTLTYEPLTTKVGPNSMWSLQRRPFARERRETRLIIPLEVLVETLDENGNPAIQEYTVTETLSSLGTCIPTNLDVGVGRIIKISSVKDQVSIFAVIRSRQVGPDGIARLGLEFIGERWPLHRD